MLFFSGCTLADRNLCLNKSRVLSPALSREEELPVRGSQPPEHLCLLFLVVLVLSAAAVVPPCSRRVQTHPASLGQRHQLAFGTTPESPREVRSVKEWPLQALGAGGPSPPGCVQGRGAQAQPGSQPSRAAARAGPGKPSRTAPAVQGELSRAGNNIWYLLTFPSCASLPGKSLSACQNSQQLKMHYHSSLKQSQKLLLVHSADPRSVFTESFPHQIY